MAGRLWPILNAGLLRSIDGRAWLDGCRIYSVLAESSRSVVAHAKRSEQGLEDLVARAKTIAS